MNAVSSPRLPACGAALLRVTEIQPEHGKTFEEIEAEFDGKGYGDFKTAVGEAVVEELRPIRERYEKLVADKAYLESCYRKADEIALKISSRTMGKVMKKIGFI